MKFENPNRWGPRFVAILKGFVSTSGQRGFSEAGYATARHSSSEPESCLETRSGGSLIMMKSRQELVVSVACCHMAFTTEAQSRMADLSIFMVHDPSEKAEKKPESKTESSGI